MNTEYEIIEGLKAGHEEAYKYIYERQYKILCIIAKEYVDDTFTAEMIVSDVIFALWKNRKEIDINLSLRSYLIKAVRNRCLNYLAQLNKREDVRSHIGDLLEKEQTVPAAIPLPVTYLHRTADLQGKRKLLPVQKRPD